jgi:hypothetical protein
VFFLKKNLDVVLGPNKGLTIKIDFPKSIKMESGLSLIIWGVGISSNCLTSFYMFLFSEEVKVMY